MHVSAATLENTVILPENKNASMHGHMIFLFYLFSHAQNMDMRINYSLDG
jgi:hypothetical protein